MQIFKNKPFDRWARKENLSDKVLLAAVSRMEENSIDASLGGFYLNSVWHMEGGGKVEVNAQYWLIKEVIKLFFSMVFPKMSKIILARKMKKH